MKNYTVREIADILRTNPETVRRWIRDGKLEADQSSRKNGNVVTEQSFNKFLQESPKYKGIAAGTLGIMGLPIMMANAPIIATTLLGAKILNKATSEQAQNNTVFENYKLPISEIIKAIDSAIENSYNNISYLQMEKDKLEFEIDAEKEQIDKLKSLRHDLLNGQSGIKSDIED